MAKDISGWGRSETSAPRFDEDRLRRRFGAIPPTASGEDDDFAEFEEDDFDDDFDDDFEEDLEDEYNDLNLDDDDLDEGELDDVPPGEVVFVDDDAEDLDDDEESPGGDDDEEIPEDEE